MVCPLVLRFKSRLLSSLPVVARAVKPPPHRSRKRHFVQFTPLPATGTYAPLKERLISALAVLITRCVSGVEGMGFQVTDA